MDERAKKVAAILLAPKIGVHVRLLHCDHLQIIIDDDE
jgi:hypothetical protein